MCTCTQLLTVCPHSHVLKRAEKRRAARKAERHSSRRGRRKWVRATIQNFVVSNFLICVLLFIYYHRYFNISQTLFKAELTDEHIEKLCDFLKDREIEVNSFEKEISKWATHFYMKMNTLCSKKPRFSEMRPVKYNIWNNNIIVLDYFLALFYAFFLFGLSTWQQK